MDKPTPSGRPLREIFGEIAGSYERVNRVLTLGLDRGWRRRAARRAARGGGSRWLDVCSGTGEMARDLARLAPAGTEIAAVDFSLPMLARARTKPGLERTGFVLGDVKRLPFPDATFDLVTISFATRNINISRPILEATFREFLRVLRPGGRFVNLETSQPAVPVVRALFHAYVGILVRRVGWRMSGALAGYAYLASSIRAFYGPGELAGILLGAGFDEVAFERLFFGAAAIHVSRKR
ncbi:MAG TPA: ubiquinone/menaquinone biosynthesis methyltransferase [Candidatus Aminicenantes bacterium]|nr:ubiquinone/menaquinone biosynthesis methyltransferase [Candidatus Aminicenantes bacterium]HRY64365.1 ubiquinone/menaquinone biosynthesis methyltransferase [Candidatus Aminicenantes bacterium]HRZ71278.1 ubiquinone/menaquinone biosynthesis methyltransferase [Candidatus Aminicenantes bacterium]